MRFLMPLVCAWLGIAAQAGSLRFSSDEWKDPGQSGSTVWLCNPGKQPERLQKVFLKSDGLLTFEKISLKIGRTPYVFTPSKTQRGLWIGKIAPPVKRKHPRSVGNAPDWVSRQPVRIRARDSVAISDLEWSHHQSGSPADTKLYENFYLELSVQPFRGGPCVVRISQSAPQYIISEDVSN